MSAWSTIPRVLLTTATAMVLPAVASLSQEQPSARTIRTTAARAQLGRLFSAEVPGLAGGAVEGQLVERLPGSYVFVPSQAGLPQAPVSNPDKVGALAVGLPLKLKGTLDAKGRLKIESYEILRTRKRAPAANPSPALRTVQGATSTILRNLEAAIQPGAMDVVSRSLTGPSSTARDTARGIATIVGEYREAVEGHRLSEASAIVEEWADVRTTLATVFSDEPQYKAIYGFSDNYAPWRYRRISDQSPAVVALGEPGSSRARCSGVLVAPDLVLTAGHCFSGPPVKTPTELEVWFDYAEDTDGNTLPIKRRPVEAAVAPAEAKWAQLLNGGFGSELLDFAIIRFKAPAGEPLVPNDAPIQCLRTTSLPRGEPLYVVGYPRGDRVTVHANARVYLPYRELDGDRFFQLRLDVEADLLGFPNRPELMQQFDDSYELHTDAGVPWRVFYSVVDGGQPRMGIVADTFRGNSGGPVYDHLGEQCVAGILIAGASDTGVRRDPNWKEHERVLPVSAILDALRGDSETASLADSLAVR